MNALIYVICDIQYTRRIYGYHCYTLLNSFVLVNIKGMVKSLVLIPKRVR